MTDTKTKIRILDDMECEANITLKIYLSRNEVDEFRRKLDELIADYAI
jgi:hypothetical protein